MEEMEVKEVSDAPDRVLSYIQKVEWRHWLNRPYYPFVATFCWSGLQEEYFKKVGFDYFGTSSTLYQFPDLYYSDDFEKKSDEWAENFFSKNRVVRLSDMLAEVHKENLLNLHNILTSDETPQIKLQKYFELGRMYMPFLWVLLSIENHFSKKIDEAFPEYYGDDYKRQAADLSIPIKKNVYALMIDALMSGLPIADVQKKFGWMKSRDGFGSFYTREELEEIRSNHEVFKTSSLEIPEGLKELVADLRELSFFRTDRTDKFYELLNGGRELFEEVANFYEISMEELKLCDAQALLYGEVKKCPVHFSYALYKNEYIIQDKPFFPNLNLHDKKEMKGAIAFKGKVRGIVKIVTTSEDICKVGEGDVLVSQMTFPSFISAMQKAVAFVTDEGGITCHAAIIARELKKPCIIGTKIATQVLKDGDLVEVDACPSSGAADNGVVRVLKK